MERHGRFRAVGVALAGRDGRVAAVTFRPYPWVIMSRPTNIILHSPLRDLAALDAFVERCLCDRVAWIAIVGDGAALIEEIIDEIVVGQGNDPDRFILTSSHSAEELVILTSLLDRDGTVEVREVRL